MIRKVGMAQIIKFLRPKGFEPVADKEPLMDLKKGVTSELHFKDTFWQLCGG